MVAFGEWSPSKIGCSEIGCSDIGRSEIGRSEIGHSGIGRLENGHLENGRCTLDRYEYKVLDIPASWLFSILKLF
jgi:hypothetical protein